MKRRAFLRAGIGLTWGSAWTSNAWALDDMIAQVEHGLPGANGSANIQERMAHYKVPDVSVAVVRHGSLAWAKGYGVTQVGTKKPVTKETLFQAASISKPVTAMAAMRLVQEGKLSLDEDVNRRLKSWKVPESVASNGKSVTLRLLLSHAAGLNVHGFGGYASGKAVPTLLQVLDGKPPANSTAIRVQKEPGSEFQYSGGGYCIVQQLIMDVTGMSFPQAMHALVFEPIEMLSSTFEQPIPDALESKAASGHAANGSMIAGGCHIYPEKAAAGLWSTSADLARFGMELSQSAAGKSQRVLTTKSAQEMLARQHGGYALGVSLRNRFFAHDGSNAGYRCTMLFHRDSGDGIVVMTGSDQGGRLMTEIRQSVAKVYSWPA
jgi:CubicO group peptidase (beta-lactamase class C family)